MIHEVPAVRRILRCLALALLVAVLVTGCGRTARSCNSGSGCGLVLIDGETGAVMQTYPASLSGADVVSDGHGGWFVAGAGPGGWPPLAHLRADGRIDEGWRPALPLGASPRDLIASGGRIYTSF